ncbi:MAG: alpha/beta fold hydrolase [Myxococcota bacterium]|nr:alpha/beta fold hydrolase [Myxococcota bacterium]
MTSAIFEDAPVLPRWLDNELPFRRRVARVDGRRIHFVDEGAGTPVLLMHGNPTWCFLWRKVIARLREHEGLRLIAPDLLGLGLSDKLPNPADHRLDVHARAIARLTEVLELEDAIVVAQDWGGPIGVGAAMLRSEGGKPFLRGLVLGNTAVLEPKRPLRTTSFHRFSHLPIASDLAFRGLLFPVPVMHRVQGDRRSIGSREKAAYAWPLRRLGDRAAPLGLARMVPDREEHPSVPFLDRLGGFVRAYRGPAALVWGERDPILGRALARHREALPQATVEITSAGHFLQEEVPDELARAVRTVAGM